MPAVGGLTVVAAKAAVPAVGGLGCGACCAAAVTGRKPKLTPRRRKGVLKVPYTPQRSLRATKRRPQCICKPRASEAASRSA